MAVRDYLKIAASHLHKASQSLQNQAHDLVTERDRRAGQRAKEISRHQLDIKARQVELSFRDDSREKARLAAEVQQIQKQIDTKQQEVKQLTDQFTKSAQYKKQNADALFAKARALELQASSPDLAD